jgi:hypothetical protein
MTSQFNQAHIETMAWTIDRNGIDAIPPAVLRELGFVARGSGVHAAITETLVDPAAAPVTRNRAFGFIARHLGRHTAETRTPAACAA